MFRGFWAWLRRLFSRNANSQNNGRRSAQQGRRLGIEFLERREVPAATLSPAFSPASCPALVSRAIETITLDYGATRLNASNGRSDSDESVDAKT